MTPEEIAEAAADELVKDEYENLGLAYVTAQMVVQRLREAGLITEGIEDNIVSAMERLIQRVNDLELQLADLQGHSHPWKPEPRYGGRL